MINDIVMKIYYNEVTGEYYYEGKSMTRRLPDGSLWSGVPTAERLNEWGYKPYEPQTPEPTEEEIRQQRMQEIVSELQSMDYLTSKYIDGEDMTEYGDWQAKRKALREEYRQLESEQNEE